MSTETKWRNGIPVKFVMVVDYEEIISRIRQSGYYVIEEIDHPVIKSLYLHVARHTGEKLTVKSIVGEDLSRRYRVSFKGEK